MFILLYVSALSDRSNFFVDVTVYRGNKYRVSLDVAAIGLPVGATKLLGNKEETSLSLFLLGTSCLLNVQKASLSVHGLQGNEKLFLLDLHNERNAIPTGKIT